jgi:hypothetical protein
MPFDFEPVPASTVLFSQTYTYTSYSYTFPSPNHTLLRHGFHCDCHICCIPADYDKLNYKSERPRKFKWQNRRNRSILHDDEHLRYALSLLLLWQQVQVDIPIKTLDDAKGVRPRKILSFHEQPQCRKPRRRKPCTRNTPSGTASSIVTSRIWCQSIQGRKGKGA